MTGEGAIPCVAAHRESCPPQIKHAAGELEGSTLVTAGKVTELLIVPVQGHGRAWLDDHFRTNHSVQIPEHRNHIGCRQAQCALVHLDIALELVSTPQLKGARPRLDKACGEGVVHIAAEVRDRRIDGGHRRIVHIDVEGIGSIMQA